MGRWHGRSSALSAFADQLDRRGSDSRLLVDTPMLMNTGCNHQDRVPLAELMAVDRHLCVMRVVNC